MEMQRARTRPRLGRILPRRFQLRRRRVQRVDMNAVATQIVDIGEAIVRRVRSKMRVRRFLAIAHRTMARVVLRPNRLAQLSLALQKACRAPAAIVGCYQRPPGMVESDMARPLRGCILRRKWAQFTVLNRKARHLASRLAVEAVYL